MKRTDRCVAVLFASAVLAACGGGGGGGSSATSAAAEAPPEPSTGVFLDSPVEGVLYETASQSGLTDVDGQFLYLEGETVTFSIGGIILGSAPAAPEVTPFDLFGVEPPADEKELRRLRRNTESVDDWARAANVARLLLALDADADPGNGIDVTAWADVLVDAELDFAHSFSDFYYDVFEPFARRYGVNQRIRLADPVVHLYDTLGIQVAANVLVSREIDYEDDGVINDSSAYAYRDNGVLRSRTTRRDDNGDGLPNRIEQREYNDRGRLLSRIDEDYDRNTGTLERVYRSESTYDALGQEVEDRAEEDSPVDGEVDSVSLTRRTYDDFGNLLSAVTEEDRDNDGVFEGRRERRYTFDDRGNRLTEFFEDTGRGGDDPGRSYLYTLTFDDSGKPLTRLYEFDGNRDGEIDSRELLTWTYSTAGQELTSRQEYDDNNDGVVDTIEETVNEYDENGRLVFSDYRYDGDGDGESDESYECFYAYDEQGRLVRERELSDEDGDGVADSITVNEYSFDDAGNTVGVRWEYDENGDGEPEEVEVTTLSYDDSGQRIEEIEDHFDDEGNLTRRSQRLWSYNAVGAPTEYQFRSDRDGDGEFERTDVTRYTYMEIAEGLYYLMGNNDE